MWVRLPPSALEDTMERIIITFDWKIFLILMMLLISSFLALDFFMKKSNQIRK